MPSSSIATYFSFPKAKEITYNDFSLANIIYAGIAAENGYSLRAAARIMAGAMKIPDNVLLNDDAAMYLGALTSSGRRVYDEAEIVSWDNETDSFVDVFFKGPSGADITPELCIEAWKAIIDADLVILSSGTQWSSLIPTYASRGFQEALAASKATMIMVVNRVPDRDGPGQTASELIRLLVPRYLPPGRVHAVADAAGHPSFARLESEAREKLASFTLMDLSLPDTPSNQHDPQKLANAIANVYFRDYLNGDVFVFDYDDTLCSRRRSDLQRTNRANVLGISFLNSVTNVAICTGNAIKAVDFSTDLAEQFEEDVMLRVFADSGINEYLLRLADNLTTDIGPRKPERCISPEALLPESGPYSSGGLIASLERAGIPRAMI